MDKDRSSSISNINGLVFEALYSPDKIPSLPEARMDLLLQLLRRARLLGRVAVELERVGMIESLPRVARDQLEGALVMARARERVALWELTSIGKAMRGAEPIKLICAKGCAYVLLGLPNAPGRIFADVDLLVPESDLDAVEHILEEQGWTMKDLTPYDDNYYRLWTHELPPMVHDSRDVEVDIHHNIVPRTARLKPDASLLVAEAVPIDGTQYHVLCDTDLLLHTMVHLMFDSDLSDKIRDLVDIHELVVHFGADDEFWRRLLGRARRLDLERPLFYSLRYSQALLRTEIPQDVLGEISEWGPAWPALWLMDRLVPRALLPLHPVDRSTITSVARFMLFIRSFWIRMPPWLLCYHLLHKLLVIVGLRISAFRSPSQTDQQ